MEFKPHRERSDLVICVRCKATVKVSDKVAHVYAVHRPKAVKEVVIDWDRWNKFVEEEYRKNKVGNPS